MKKFFPHILAITGFIIVTMVYLSPLLEGKKVRQSDVAQWLGGSKEIIDFRAKTGAEPYWTNSMFGGMPAYQITSIYKGNLIQYIDKIITLGLPSPADRVFLYLIGFYFLLITLRVNQRVAVLG